jgi:hypothetical protein
MKASLVAYDFRELWKKPELKIVKVGYVRGCQKYPSTQIWLLEILGVKSNKNISWLYLKAQIQFKFLLIFS